MIYLHYPQFWVILRHSLICGQWPDFMQNAWCNVMSSTWHISPFIYHINRFTRPPSCFLLFFQVGPSRNSTIFSWHVSHFNLVLFYILLVFKVVWRYPRPEKNGIVSIYFIYQFTRPRHFNLVFFLYFGLAFTKYCGRVQISSLNCAKLVQRKQWNC